MRPDHRALDPRSKLAFAAAVSLVAVAIPELVSLAALAVVLVALVALGRGLGLGEWLATLAPFKLLIPVVFALNAVFYGGGEVLWSSPVLGAFVRLTTGGLHASAVIVARLLVIAAAASWFSATTDPEAFEAALERLGVPWTVAFLCSLTLRLVPEMRERFRTIEDAQRARGLRIEGGPLARARARIPMFIPFLASVIRYGFELSEALVVRDFGHARRRTSTVRLAHTRSDYLLYSASVAVLLGFLAVFAV